MIYNTGAVTIKVGSAIVKGSTGNENFVTNVANGHLFKLLGESTFFTLAGINSATNFTLSSRYVNTSYQTARGGTEHCATINITATKYTGTLNYYPVIQSACVLTASEETFTDGGAGLLISNASPPGSGVIDYDTGVWTVVLGSLIGSTLGGVTITASYQSGDTRTGIPYQIVTDYTPRYSIPEMGLNDVNFANIYTKGVRIIDSSISKIASTAVGANATAISGINASINNLQASMYLVNASITYLGQNVPSGLTASINNLQASMYLANITITNLQASNNQTRTVVKHGTATKATIPIADLNKIHTFYNATNAMITIATISSADEGKWIMLRKKAIGILDFKRGGANTFDGVATHFMNNNASQTNALLKLSIETATNFEIENMIGDWVSY